MRTGANVMNIFWSMLPSFGREVGKVIILNVGA
jgi:hypothetical protein